MPRQIAISILPYLGMIVVSVVLLRWLVWLSGGRLQLAHLRNLHRDEEGGVQSLSFVLTLPVFIMIMMFIVQLSQLTIAKAVVEYAAFAAARSAIVWIPANEITDEEYANQIGTQLTFVETDAATGHLIYEVSPGSAKFEKISFAAAMACLPICPSRDSDLGPAHPSVESLQRAYLDFAPTSAANTRIPNRIENKVAYSLANTLTYIRVRHPSTEPALISHVDVPPDPSPPFLWEFAYNEIGWQDQIEVTVVHNFALLPGPGRLLAKRAVSPYDSQAVDAVSENIGQDGDVFVYPISATVRLPNEGQKSVVPFFQDLNGLMGS